MSDWVEFDFFARIRSRVTNWLQQEGQVPDLFCAVGYWHPEIEKRHEYIYLTYSIYNSHGIELDRFGEYVDVPRQGRDDDTYRQAILNKRHLQFSSGTPPDIYLKAEMLTAATDMYLVEMRCASYSLHILSDAIITPQTALDLDKSSVGGVSTYVTFSRGMGKSFSFGGIGNSDTVLGLQQSDNGVLGIDNSHALGIDKYANTVGKENLGGLDVTPNLLGHAGTTGAIGVNGVALALNKFKPIATPRDDGIYLAGTYQ